MNNSNEVKPQTTQHTVSPGIWSTFRIIPTVVLVAIILATMFTAWTGTGLISGGVGTKYQIVTSENQANTGSNAAIDDTSVQRIGIVAGHSGNDSGAICPDGLTEASINQKVASFVQQYLSEHKIQVDILKEFDDRLNGYKALALISIHADSCDYINDQATGFKVASALNNPHPERANRLTTCLRNRYAQVTGLPLHNSITNDMTSYHAFDEIDNETSAVIIEVGFLNLDRQLLTQHTDLVAKGIAEGILCYINNEDATIQTTPKTTPQSTP
jgi:N-acetylmuramoyl-L-alanine amidase